jgi:hypothetical protein
MAPPQVRRCLECDLRAGGHAIDSASAAPQSRAVAIGSVFAISLTEETPNRLCQRRAVAVAVHSDGCLPHAQATGEAAHGDVDRNDERMHAS